LLAGDAAHIMKPFLGQGLCSGIKDADNLAWKLAYVLSGRASPELITQTYTQERRPIVEQVMNKSNGVVQQLFQIRDGRLPAASHVYNQKSMIIPKTQVAPTPLRAVDCSGMPFPRVAMESGLGAAPLWTDALMSQGDPPVDGCLPQFVLWTSGSVPDLEQSLDSWSDLVMVRELQMKNALRLDSCQESFDLLELLMATYSTILVRPDFVIVSAWEASQCGEQVIAEIKRALFIK